MPLPVAAPAMLATGPHASLLILPYEASWMLSAHQLPSSWPACHSPVFAEIAARIASLLSAGVSPARGKTKWGVPPPQMRSEPNTGMVLDSELIPSLCALIVKYAFNTVVRCDLACRPTSSRVRRSPWVSIDVLMQMHCLLS